jgi:hypothetical protein
MANSGSSSTYTQAHCDSAAACVPRKAALPAATVFQHNKEQGQTML